MTKELIKKIIRKLLYLKSEYILNRNINKLYKKLNVKNSNLNEDFIKKHKIYWSQLKKNVNTKWFKVYSTVNGNSDIQYIPENIYFNIIEPKLNNRSLAYAYADKNFYEIFYNERDLFPESIIRNIDGFFYDRNFQLLNENNNLISDYLSNYGKIIVKPSTESGGGKRVELFVKNNGIFVNSANITLSLDYLKNIYRTNYIIQNYISQSNYLAQFNKSSLNTIRIFTYRSVINDKILPLHSILRIGKKGNFIDDQNVGGIACRIKSDGKLMDFGTDIFGKKYSEYNGISFAQVGRVPEIEKIKNIASQMARKNIHSRLLGFDFAVDINNKIKIIEVNHLWIGINFFQMNSSSVLGQFTDEVIQFCKKTNNFN